MPRADRSGRSEAEGTPIPVHRLTGSSGAPVVLGVHDFSSNGLWFGQLAEACGGHLTWIAPDLRGRGDAHAYRPAASLDVHIEDIAGTMGQVGATACTLVGHGTGAATAWMTALVHPGSVDRIVLLDGPVEPDEPVGRNDADWVDAAARIDPGITRLRGTYPHRDRLIAEGIATGRLPSTGLSRPLRRAVDAEVAGSGFAWRARLSATALEHDWRHLSVWRPPAAPSVPIIGFRARHGHRPDDAALRVIGHPAVQWQTLGTTHNGLLWDRDAVTTIAECLTAPIPA